MVYDHAQSPRLGQPTPVESTSIRMFSGAEIPEAAWRGQMIYRTDTQVLQVFNGDAWEDVVGGVEGQLTFVGPDEPVANSVGDLWFESDDGNRLRRWNGVIWEDMRDQLVVENTDAIVVHEGQISALDIAMGTAQDAIDQAEADLLAHQGVMDGLQIALDAAESDIAGAQTNIDGLLTDMGAAQSDITAAQSAIAAANSDIDAAEGRLDVAEGEIGALGTDLSAAQAAAAAAQSDADTAQAGADAALAKALDAIKSVVTEYALGSSETVAPTTGWSTSPPARTPGSFIWARTTTTYNDDTTTTADPVLVTGNTGEQGSQGIPGEPGADGSSLYTWIKYADTPTTGMSDSPAGKTYMGLAINKTSQTESSSYGAYQWSLIKGADGEQGIPGEPGADGQPTYTWIKYATSAAGAGMSDDPTGKTYVGLAHNKTTATESSTASDYKWSLIQGPAGADGADGPPGADGADGRGITSTTIAYQVSASGTVIPTGTWVSNPPATSAGQFLWTRTTINFTDSTSVKAYAVAAHGATGPAGADGTDGADGSPGAPGADGADGTDGVSVDSITSYYLLVTDGNPAPAKPTANPPGGSWSPTEPAWVSNTDLYRAELVVFSDSTHAWTAVSKVSSYTAANKGIEDAAIAANLATSVVKASASDPGHQPGRIWLQLNGSGQTTGIKISDGSTWSSYLLAADQVLVPSSVGSVLIANGAVAAEHLQSNSVSTRNLSVTGGNWITNPGFEDHWYQPHWLTADAAFSFVSASHHRGGSRSLRVDVNSAVTTDTSLLCTNGHYETEPENHPRVQVGERWRFSCWVYRHIGFTTARARMQVRAVDGTYLAGAVGSVVALPGGWSELSVEMDITHPDAAIVMGFVYIHDAPSGNIFYLDDMRLEKMTDGNLIVENAIEAKHIVAEKIAATDILATGSISTSDLFTTGSINGNIITANTLDAEKIRSSSITTAKMAVTGTNMVANPSFEVGEGDLAPHYYTNSTHVGWHATAHTGTRAIHLSLNDAATYVGTITFNGVPNSIRGHHAPVQSGQRWKGSAWVRPTLGAGAAKKMRGYLLWWNESGNVLNTVGTEVTLNAWDWFEITAEADVPAGAKYVAFHLQHQTTGVNVIVDDVWLKEMTGANLIVEGAIEARHIITNGIDATDIIATGSINTTDLFATGTISGDIITGNTLHGDKITAGTIATERLAVVGTNLVNNPSFENGMEPHWTPSENGEVSYQWATTAHTGTQGLRVNALANLSERNVLGINGWSNAQRSHPTVSPGEEIHASAMIYGSAGVQVRMAINCRKADGSATGADWGTSKVVTLPGGTAWTEVANSMVVPVGTVYCNLLFYIQSATTGQFIIMDSMEMRSKTRSHLIVDGAIGANHIITNGIDAEDVIATGSMTTNLFTANTINGDRITTNTLHANRITAGTITADKIGAGAITAEKMTVGMGANAIVNPGFEHVAGTTVAPHIMWGTAVLNHITSASRSGNRAAAIDLVTTRAAWAGIFNTNGGWNKDLQPAVKVGETWKASFWARNWKGTGVQVRAYIAGCDAAGTNTQSFGGAAVTLSGGVWTKVEAEITFSNANIAFASLHIQALNNAATDGILIDDLEMVRMTTGDLLVNGAIDGKTITGAEIIGGTVTGGHLYTAEPLATEPYIAIHTAPNAFDTGQNWNQVEFHTGHSNWAKGLIWGWSDAYATDGQLIISSPYREDKGKATSARIVLAADYLGKNRIALEADNYTLGSGGTNVDFRLAWTNRLIFKNQSGDRKFALTFDYFENIINMLDQNDGRINMRLKGQNIYFDVTGGQIDVMQATEAVFPWVGRWSGTDTAGFTFTGSSVRVTRATGKDYIPINASAFNVSSDGENKSGLSPVSGALDAVNAMKPYDYQTTQGDGHGRGLVAQDVERIAPDLVAEDESGKTVDLYGLLTTVIAAVKELNERVDRMER